MPHPTLTPSVRVFLVYLIDNAGVWERGDSVRVLDQVIEACERRNLVEIDRRNGLPVRARITDHGRAEMRWWLSPLATRSPSSSPPFSPR